jgi:hypothetical protein
MLYRNITRTILNSTDTTEKTKTISSLPLAFNLTTADYFYIGVKAPFTTRYFHLSVPNTNACSITVEYYNGSGWRAVEDLIDQTQGFTQSGFISWNALIDWFYSEQAPIVAVRPDPQHWLYWIRIKVSANLSATTALQSVLNLFCDDTLFQTLYPNIATSAYYPTGQTNFLPQYLAAKDLIILRLKQKGEIKDETEVIDITEVSTAAVHATAYILLNPIARDDVKRQAAKDALESMNREIQNATLTLDRNHTGELEVPEVLAGGCTFLGR